MSHTDPDEAEAIAHVEAVEQAMIAVIEQHTRLPDRADAPRYARHVALHATVDLLGRLMLSVIDVEGERGRESCQALLGHLTLAITPDTRPS